MIELAQWHRNPVRCADGDDLVVWACAATAK